MKMGLNNFSAHDVISTLDQKNLENIFKYFGQEQNLKSFPKKLFKREKKSNKHRRFSKDNKPN